MIRTLLLGGAALALTGVIYQEIALSEVRPPPPLVGRSAPQPPDNSGSAVAVSGTGDRLTEILSRPLFSPDRRPVEAARGVAGLPRLSGIVVAGPRRLAIFAAAGGGRPVVAEEGAHVGKYEVRSITDTGVTVVGPNGAAVIRPVFDAGEPQAGLAGLPRVMAK